LFGDFAMPGRFDLDRTLGAAFAEFEWKPLRRLALDGAVRVDDADGWASQISPSAAVRYQFEWLNAMTFVRWGEGFKLPSFYALGHPLVGNPQLRPETSEVIEAGVRIEPASCCSLEFAAFSNRYHDLIDFESGPPPRLVNRSTVTSRGVEGTLRAQINSRFSGSAQATFADTNVVGSDDELRNRPEWRMSTALSYAATEALQMSLHVLYVGKMHDSSIPTGDVVLNDFLQADLLATWTLDPKWRLQFALDNLADEHYQERIGVPAPGRSARAAVRYAF
jgi:outer membrane cobalamin receptor